MIEINLPVQSRYIGGLTIDDMVKKFGKRIRKAVYQENGVNKGLISVEMVKIMRWWKFWNKDIRKAYDNYTGLIQVPWTVKMEKPEVYVNSDIDDDELLKLYRNEIDPDYYKSIAIGNDDL